MIISGDSDFSPLVSKLRENAKTVIGVGVKNSSSDLFIKNCDEFIYYDDLVRKSPAKKTTKKKVARKAAKKKTAGRKSSEGPPTEAALEQVADTFEALLEERGNDEAIWGSMIKQALKRRNPGFNERAHGFRSFNEVLLGAEEHGFLKLEADERSGGYTVHPA